MTRPRECGALPLGGDDTAPCELPAGHLGLHCGAAGVFRRIKVGSSARAREMRARRRVAVMKKPARCPSVCQGNRCTRGAGHKGLHYALTPSAGWPEMNKPEPVPARAAKVQAVAKAWRRGFVAGPLSGERRAAESILLLAADAGLDAEGLRELAGRLRP